MNDFAPETKEDFASLMTAEQEPVTVACEHDVVELMTCDYCGHCPCGCGG